MNGGGGGGFGRRDSAASGGHKDAKVQQALDQGHVLKTVEVPVSRCLLICLAGCILYFACTQIFNYYFIIIRIVIRTRTLVSLSAKEEVPFK